MSYIQLKQPNLSIVGQEGLCLAYVTAVFGVANHYSSATLAWAGAQYRHPNEQPPAGVSVPVWFKYNGPDGHVAVWANGVIHSTSAQGMKTFNSIQELCTWMGEGMTYLGWSEDINNVKVVTEEIIMGVTVQGSPGSVSWGPNRLDVFARGSDNNLWHKWWDGAWHSWEQVGASIFSDPTVSSWAVGRLDVFAAGLKGDLIHYWYDNTGYHGPESLGPIN